MKKILTLTLILILFTTSIYSQGPVYRRSLEYKVETLEKEISNLKIDLAVIKQQLTRKADKP